MSAGIARRLGPLVMVLAGCGEKRPPEPVELPYGSKQDLEDRRERGEWALERPNESLRFFVGQIEREDPWEPPRGESASLPDGGILAALCITVSEGYEYETCYLQLEPAGDGWRPVAVGVYDGSCVGFWWFEGLEGRVTVDPTEGHIICRIDLESTEGIWDSFRGDFLVDPSTSSVGLQNKVRDWPRGGPLSR